MKLAVETATYSILFWGGGGVFFFKYEVKIIETVK